MKVQSNRYSPKSQKRHSRKRAVTDGLALIVLLLAFSAQAQAAGKRIEVCPPVGIQPRTADFQPGGIILTSFDRDSLWVYDIDRDRRYPLPDTHPCGTNCRLSRDARWITYVDADTYTYAKMRLDGTQRTVLVDYAADVEWWSDSTLLVWTPSHEAYLQVEGGQEREYLDVRGVVSVQPGGIWGIRVEQDGDVFRRLLVNLATRNVEGVPEERFELGTDTPYFNAFAWSPDGKWLAYVASGAFDRNAGTAGGELFGIRPGDTQPVQWTDLTASYGAARINGATAGELSWSPDSQRIAFWVMELLGPNPEANAGNAVIHILDIATGDVRVYCGFATTEHTPNPPRLIWSPDGTHLTFGGNIPGDDKGYLLLALDIETGIFTELSNGIYPALGSPDAVAWGLKPG